MLGMVRRDDVEESLRAEHPKIISTICTPYDTCYPPPYGRVVPIADFRSVFQVHEQAPEEAT